MPLNNNEPVPTNNQHSRAITDEDNQQMDADIQTSAQLHATRKVSDLVAKCTNGMDIFGPLMGILYVFTDSLDPREMTVAIVLDGVVRALTAVHLVSLGKLSKDTEFDARATILPKDEITKIAECLKKGQTFADLDNATVVKTCMSLFANSSQRDAYQEHTEPSIHSICFASRAMSSKPFQVKSDISGRFSSQDSSRLESPVTDPDNWEPAVLIPAKGPESETNISQNPLNTAIGKYKKTSPPLQTAMSTSVRTAKANTVYATPKVNTTTRSQKTSKSLMASTQKTTDSARVTPLSTSSTQKSMNPLLDSEFGLKLNKESMELIKTDYITRYSPNGRDLPEDKQAALTTLECYSSHLETRLRECGQYLDEMVGDRCVMIREARKALEQIVSMGIITTEELVASPDCERFSLASDNDVITIHSLSNIVRKIINSRRVVA